MQRDVFISHSSKNLQEANEVRAFLRGQGISCWMAPRDIAGGRDYGEEIMDAIEGCKVLLLLLTKEAQMDSVWVIKELDIAISGRKRVIPLHLDKSNIEKGFRFRLENIQIVEAYNRKLVAQQEMLEIIWSVVGKPQREVLNISQEHLYNTIEKKQKEKAEEIKKLSGPAYFLAMARCGGSSRKFEQYRQKGKVAEQEARAYGEKLVSDARRIYCTNQEEEGLRLFTAICYAYANYLVSIGDVKAADKPLYEALRLYNQHYENEKEIRSISYATILAGVANQELAKGNRQAAVRLYGFVEKICKSLEGECESEQDNCNRLIYLCLCYQEICAYHITRKEWTEAYAVCKQYLENAEILEKDTDVALVYKIAGVEKDMYRKKAYSYMAQICEAIHAPAEVIEELQKKSTN